MTKKMQWLTLALALMVMVPSVRADGPAKPKGALAAAVAEPAKAEG